MVRCDCLQRRSISKTLYAQSKALHNSQIIRAALVVLVGFLTSGILGFVRTGVLALQFGAGAALDSFLYSPLLPYFIRRPS
jgi:peptidoglycan biosynthesis protein MviN/MurJ (putative lipid II flippase)